MNTSFRQSSPRAALRQRSLWSASRWLIFFGAALLVLAALGPSRARTAILEPASATDPVIAVASDVQIESALSTTNAVATSNVASSFSPDAAWLAGDEADDATTTEYNTYSSHWGSLPNLHVVPGNHDTASYTNYASYFGTRGTPFQRAEDVGAWRVYFLDANADLGVGSATYNWLQSDLAAHSNQPIAAVWHQPRWSSDNVHGDDTASAAVWSLLYGAHADLVINGHTHGYQRWTKLAPDGVASADGIREFVVATGGHSGYNWKSGTDTLKCSSVPSGHCWEYRQNTDLGAMKLVLHPTSYEWQFTSTSGAVMDQGSESTHNTGTPDTTPPATPTGLNATARDGAVSLSWTANTEVDLAGYQVYRQNADGTWPTTPLNSTLLGGSSYTDAPLTNGTSYTYRVTAVDKANNESAASTWASATPVASADTTPPTAPTGLRVTAVSASRVDLTWKASNDNVGVASYRIYRDGQEVGWTIGSVRQYSDQTVSAATRYSYQVIAVDAAGNSSALSKATGVRTKVR